ncbi:METHYLTRANSFERASE-RELATED [Salix viminalis]|uniref:METHYLTRANSFERASE-RELATED n=1 Tax=Salix viminalis TaxID=40686 RepID=A0A9Q0T8G5_SALVM|nr:METHYLTRANSFERASE-RELATED [Salix viminalis]
MSNRPELLAPPDIFYDDSEARKYTSFSRIIDIQVRLSERVLELLALPVDRILRSLLDIGCGSGLSGETFIENGHQWIGLDISQSMLNIALEREVEGDLLLGDMGQHFDPGIIDGAISISAVQWLCNVDKSSHEPRLRLKAFFGSLYRCLVRGARAVFQVYPENIAQRELILRSAMHAGFAGGVVMDYPHSTGPIQPYNLNVLVGNESLHIKGAADANARPIIESPQSEHHRENHLVIFEDNNTPPPQHEQFLCTYQCRQLVKSDFIDALSSAEKQVQDYQSKLQEINENFTKSEAERKKFRDKLLQTEQQLAAAKGREHALQQQLLKEVNDNQERFKKQLESQANLEVKLENEKNLRQKAESSAASAEEKASVLEGKLGHLSESIEREKKHHNTELALLNRESKHSVSRIRADLETMECRAKNAEKESELWKEQLEDLKRQFTECSHQRSELEKKLSSFTFQEGSSTDSNILVKHLQEELRNFDIPGVSSYDDIPVKFAALQKEVIDNMMKAGEANACFKQMEVALETAQLGKRNAETEAAFA